MPTVTIRRNGGSFDEVRRVLAYDPLREAVACLFRDFDGDLYLDCVRVADLEAIRDDPRRTFEEVAPLLRKRAELVVKHKWETHA